MSDLLERALADLAVNPDSTAREIARRIGVTDDRRVFAVLDAAAYDGKVQCWKPGGSSAWRWELPEPGHVPPPPGIAPKAWRLLLGKIEDYRNVKAELRQDPLSNASAGEIAEEVAELAVKLLLGGVA